MPRICLPVSHLLEAPSEIGIELLAAADVLELRKPHLKDHLPDKPMVFHWGLGPVQDEFLPAFHQEGLDVFLREADVRLFSFDLGPACRKNRSVFPMSETLGPEEILKVSARALDEVRRSFDGPLAAENYNYYPTGLYEHICAPDFMARYLAELDLGLVLDLAHAQISAVNLGLPPRKYLAKLPLNRVVEIHVSRPGLHQDPPVDAHQPPGKDEFELLAFVLHLLEKPNDVLVAIETYQDLETIRECHAALLEHLSPHGASAR